MHKSTKYKIDITPPGMSHLINSFFFQILFLRTVASRFFVIKIVAPSNWVLQLRSYSSVQSINFSLDVSQK